MAVNPMALLKLKERYRLFMQQHPKMGPFVSKIMREGMREGSVLEIRVRTPEGQEYVSNIRLTADDLETISMLSGLKKG